MEVARSLLIMFVPPAIIAHILCLLTRNRKNPPGWVEGIVTSLIIGGGCISYGLWTGSPDRRLGNFVIYLAGAFLAVAAIFPAAFVIAFQCERRCRAARQQFVTEEIPEAK